MRIAVLALSGMFDTGFTVTLDAGHNLNAFESTFTVEGGAPPAEPAVHGSAGRGLSSATTRNSAPEDALAA